MAPKTKAPTKPVVREIQDPRVFQLASVIDGLSPQLRELLLKAFESYLALVTFLEGLKPNPEDGQPGSGQADRQTQGR
jgi:hypothetical protein